MNIYFLRKFFEIFFVFLFLIFIFNFLYKNIYDGGEIEIVEYIDYEDIINFDALIIRNEKLLYKNSIENCVYYLVRDGEKVGTGSKIAEIYKNLDSLNDKTEFLKLEEELNFLENEYLDLKNFDFINPDLMFEKLGIYLENLKEYKYENFINYKINILNLVMKYNFILKNENSFIKRIKELRNKVKDLKINSGFINDIYSEKNGIFMSYVDNYENSIDFENIKNIQDLNIKKNLENNNILGKIIISSDLFLICKIDSNKICKINENKNMKIKFSFKNDYVDSKIFYINKDKNFVFINTNYIDKELYNMRFDNGCLKISNYSGLKISKKSIHINEDNIKGVYIKYGNMLIFKKINAIFYGDSFVICEENLKNSIKKDDIVLKNGVNLYDKKIFQ
ncbi:MAG: secretion protein HlyD [Candidatus Paraimprobicoccus trichonymphae]|uniref:Secretion protein HlyD n=1 Tax=Candidatus Paraimprobicoccus trichonymphae TaxID=3033793 RepID=A0AA48HZ00_9FIRM|nr:MAG: secretion protein HlyD [Candidatus Paraimprobicoccus trichonymphae]